MQYKILKIDKAEISVLISKEIEQYSNILGKYIAFLDDNKKIVGELKDIEKQDEENYKATVKLIGNIEEGEFTFGVSVKPKLNSELKFLDAEEVTLIFGKREGAFSVGDSALYKGFTVNAPFNSFFSNHFAILGSTGSGKSYNVSSIFENIFAKSNMVPKHANFIIFDTYGEYAEAFRSMFKTLPNVHFQNINTDLKDLSSKKIEIPVWLLETDDWALLLNITTPLQIPIIEKALKLVKIFKNEAKETMAYKNHILAAALLDIISSGEAPAMIRDQVFSTLTYFNTPDVSLDSKVVQPGWIRTLRQCMIINDQGTLQGIEAVTNYLFQFVNPNLNYDNSDSAVIIRYNLEDFKDALEFAIISEGSFKSDRVYDYTNVLKVRLNALIKSDYSQLFVDKGYSTKGDFLKKLLHNEDGSKIQVVNISINHVDDRFAKTITKIFSKMIYDYASNLKNRASIPFHLILEEAHRYVQNDKDVEVLGYNVFERIAKEGRKFGVLLGLITQRPSELSETVMAQCANFFLFKLLHPKDVDFVRSAIPDISTDIVEKLSYLPIGHCIVFGRSFKTPQVVTVPKVTYPPHSGSVEITKLWY